MMHDRQFEPQAHIGPVFCRICGTITGSEMTVCDSCDAEYSAKAERETTLIACESCGSGVKPTWRFCPWCGGPEMRELLATAHAIGNIAGGWSDANALIASRAWPVEDDDYEIADALLAEEEERSDG